MNSLNHKQFDPAAKSVGPGSMKWRRIPDGARAVAAVFALLWVVDVAAYNITAQFIGGYFFYGEVENDEYSLAHGASHSHYPLTRVSKQVYNYSIYHYWSICALACVAAPAGIVWLIAGAACRGQQRLTVRITPSGCTLNGQPLSVDRLVETLRDARAGDPSIEIRVKNEYEAEEAPPHAIAFQVALRDSDLLLTQEGPWR